VRNKSSPKKAATVAKTSTIKQKLQPYVKFPLAASGSIHSDASSFL